MRIAYISAPAFCDCDIPLVESLQKLGNVTYILNVSETTRTTSMLNIGGTFDNTGIYHVSQFEGFENITRYLNRDKSYMLWRGNGSRKDLIKSGLKLLEFLRDNKFDIIHITWPFAYDLFPLYLLRKKIILTVHDPLPHSSNINFASQIYRKIAFKLLNNFILLNKTQKEEFISRYHLSNKNISVSRLGKYFHLSKIDPIKPELSNYVLFFGYISSYKGVDLLCQAMRRIRERVPSVKLVVAGKGEIDFDISQFVNDGTIDFKNYYISDEELAGLIKYSSFVVAPYKDATQSGVVMSSYSLDTPVVVTDVGGLPEMVGYGTYGPIVPANNVEALYEVILHLLENPNEIDSYREKIIADYSTGEYSWNRIAEEVFNVYNYTLISLG